MALTFEETATYTEMPDGSMLHTGYFIRADGFPLKRTVKSAWDEIKTRPDFPLSTARYIGMLQNAQ